MDAEAFVSIKKLNISESSVFEDVERCLLRNESALQDFADQITIDKPQESIVTVEPVQAFSPFVALDINSERVRVSLVKMNPAGTMDTIMMRAFSLPCQNYWCSCKTFFDSIARYLEDFLQYSNFIGISFPAKCKRQDNFDARIIKLADGIKIQDAEGALIGEEIIKALLRRNILSSYNIAVVDRTAAILEGCLCAHSGEYLCGIIAFSPECGPQFSGYLKDKTLSDISLSGTDFDGIAFLKESCCPTTLKAQSAQ